MALDDKAKEALKFVQEGYDEAEQKVDGWFAKDNHTVLILSTVAVALAVLIVYFLFS